MRLNQEQTQQLEKAIDQAAAAVDAKYWIEAKREMDTKALVKARILDDVVQQLGVELEVWLKKV